MTAKTKILIVEDDPYLGMIMQECFESRDFDVRLLENGQEGLDTFFSYKPDLCILDVMLPVKDGFTIARTIRETDTQTPIIFLTARSLKEDIKEGFTIGADDYVKKPFSIEELIMRVHAILKRTASQESTNQTLKNIPVNIGSFVFDFQKQLLISATKKQKLTALEADLLKMLCDNMNATLDRNSALKQLWGDDNFFNARSMDVYVTKLRKHLKDDPSVEIINIRGKGYKLLLLGSHEGV